MDCSETCQNLSQEEVSQFYSITTPNNIQFFRDVVKSTLETSLSTLEHNKTSICEAARNEDSQMFKNIQRELITGLEEEKTDADSSIGTWM